MIGFEWDAGKARRNRLKHGVSFEEAMSVFEDDVAVQFVDEVHTHAEQRFLLLGTSWLGRLLLVCHCERGEVIRIISARRATRGESEFYGGGTT